MLARRPVRGDVVTFTHELRRVASHGSPVTRDDASQSEDVDLALAYEDQDLERGGGPTVYRIRTDVSWEDIVRDVSPNTRQFLNGTSPLISYLPSPL